MVTSKNLLSLYSISGVICSEEELFQMRVHVSVSNTHVAHHNLYQWDVWWSWFVLGNESQLASLYMGSQTIKGAGSKEILPTQGTSVVHAHLPWTHVTHFPIAGAYIKRFITLKNPDTDMGSKKLRKDITTPKRLVHTKYAKSNVYQWLFVLWTHDICVWLGHGRPGVSIVGTRITCHENRPLHYHPYKMLVRHQFVS